VLRQRSSFLDACRNNPFAGRGLLSSAGGLALASGWHDDDAGREGDPRPFVFETIPRISATRQRSLDAGSDRLAA
jgi:hypothetical protein